MMAAAGVAPGAGGAELVPATPRGEPPCAPLLFAAPPALVPWPLLAPWIGPWSLPWPPGAARAMSSGEGSSVATGTAVKIVATTVNQWKHAAAPRITPRRQPATGNRCRPRSRRSDGVAVSMMVGD